MSSDIKELPIIVKQKFKFALKSMKKPVLWGTLRRTAPFSYSFGYSRGPQSVARYYIDLFMANNSTVIKGKVLEIGDDTYTIRNGTDVQHSDVLHAQEGNPKATIVADLTCASHIPAESYNCIIIPQTFQFIYDMRAALSHCLRILKPNGVILATFSGISPISRYDMDRWGEYWRLTSVSAVKLFSEFFPPDNIEVSSFGNVLSAVAFLEGLASRELKKSELDFHDPDYEVIISVKAVKKS
jgi:hypothetical protein